MNERAPNSERARGRELALLTLCHLESYDPSERGDAVGVLWDSPPDGAGSELPGLLKSEAARVFARRLLDRANADLEGLDRLIEDTSDRWRVERMDRVDRNVLRLCAVELDSETQTPRAVALAEAVRLAERYGGDRSAPFVNGVCEALARRLRPAEADA